MPMKFFTVPAFGGEGAEAELNRFLATHRILGLDRQFVQDGANSAWCLRVSYQGPEVGEGATATVAPAGPPPASRPRGRVDYKDRRAEPWTGSAKTNHRQSPPIPNAAWVAPQEL